MSDLYPLLLQPDFRERPWGTRDLSPIYAQAPGENPIGEVWLTGDDNRVANGPLAGRTLRELCQQCGREMGGDVVRETDRFPLLIKFLFPTQKLSVQVHPDDDTARRAGLPCGKTECWYVLAAKPGAQVALGIKPGTTRAQFEQAIKDKRAEFLLNWVMLKPGDMIYVDAGTVHTIGPGSILVETQQNSDTTYRLYDYGRPRELHVREGLDAMKERTRAGKVRRTGSGDPAGLIFSPCFLVNKYTLAGKESWTGASTSDWNTVHVLVALDGCGVVEATGMQSVTFARGEAVVVPAAISRFDVRPQWELEFLAMVMPPAGTTAEPETSLEDTPVVASS